MRNPLDSILNQIASISIFSGEFTSVCCEEIKQIHRFNWEANNSVQQYYIDDEGLFQPVIYDPEKW
jgi:hypothetical protein